jgi:hypothetical protein
MELRSQPIQQRDSPLNSEGGKNPEQVIFCFYIFCTSYTDDGKTNVFTRPIWRSRHSCEDIKMKVVIRETGGVAVNSFHQSHHRMHW